MDPPKSPFKLPLPSIPLPSRFAKFPPLNLKDRPDQLTNVHDDSIDVKSAYYQRHQLFKGPCDCPYHRMKRYKQCNKLTRQDRSSIKKLILDTYRRELAKSGRTNLPERKLPQLSRHTHKVATQNELNGQKMDKLTVRESVMKQKIKEATDHINYEFEEVLRARINAMSDDEKVVRLLKFVKMESAQNPSYLIRSRSKMFNFLLRVVRKFGFDGLRNFQDVNSVWPDRIALLTNDHDRSGGLHFIEDVKQAIEDMEQYLIMQAKLRNLQQESKLREQQQKNDPNHLIPPNTASNLSIRNSNQLLSSQNILEACVDAEIRQKEGKSTNGTLKINLKDLNKNMLLVESGRSDGNGFRSKKLIESHRNKMNREEQEQQRQKQEQKNEQSAEQRVASVLHKVSYRNDQRTSLVRIQKPSYEQKDSENCSGVTSDDDMEKTHGNRLEAKFRKTRSNKPSRVFELNSSKRQSPEAQPKKMSRDDTKLLKRPTEKFVDKENKTIFSQTNKSLKPRQKAREGHRKLPPVNIYDSLNFASFFRTGDLQRAKGVILDAVMDPFVKVNRLFVLLEKRLGETEDYMDRFLEEFKSVLNAEQVQEFKKKYEEWKHERMIEKLAKQMDECIQILNKVVLPEEFIDHDNFEYKQEKVVKSQYIEIECGETYKSAYGDIDRFVIVETEPVSQVAEEDDLEQTGLGEMQLQEMSPNLTESIYLPIGKRNQCKTKLKYSQHHVKGSLLNEKEHRRILRFMKLKFPKQFLEVRSSVKATLSVPSSP